MRHHAPLRSRSDDPAQAIEDFPQAVLSLRRLWRVNCEALMRAAGQNLKRLLQKRGWGRRPYPAEAVCIFFLAIYRRLTRPFWRYVPLFLALDPDDPLLKRVCMSSC